MKPDQLLEEEHQVVKFTQQKSPTEPNSLAGFNAWGQPLAATAQKEQISCSEDFKGFSPKKSPARKVPDQLLQPEERQVGDKIRAVESDAGRYGPDLVEIFKAHDRRKRAKRELINTQLEYEEACSNLKKLKSKLLTMFDEMSANEDSAEINH